MSDWRIGRLGDLATGTRGVSYTPDQLRELKGPETVTLLRSNNIQSGRLNFNETQIVPRSVVSDAQVMRTGDIAVCMSNGSKTLVGKAAPLVVDIGESLTVGAFCSIFRPTEGAVPDFVKYLFQSADYRRQLDFSLAGSAINNLRNSELQTFRIPVPPSGEQRGIAKVLDTLDTTIRQTEAIIEKLKQVKQGLLHDLLTRGIDANGELRPPQSQAPHLYKDSPLGWIPREWSVETLPGLALGGLMNGVFKEPRRVGSGVALVNVADLYRGQNVDLNRCERFAATTAEVERFGAQRGDIFFTRSSLKLEGIAQTSFLDDEPESAVFECHVMRLRPNPKLAVPRFLKEWCVARPARTHFMSHAKQVTMTTISQDGISSLRCPVPPLPEQFEAVRRISAVDIRVSAEGNDLRKARLLKSGLMDDLLTGRVRVTPLLNAAARA